MHDDRYIQNILLRKKSFWVACTKYPEYPISIHEDEHFWVCVEGKIYGQADTDIKREINALLIEVSKSGERIEQRGGVNRWLSITDGEFVIYALNKESNEFFIINDILGRLPLYYYGDDMRLIISRELSFVSYLLWNDIDIRNIENKENKFLFDRMAIAQYLLFGYPLDKRTLISDIYRMQPGTLGRISNGKCDKFEDGIPSGTCFNIENLYSFDVGQNR
jgi:asparagine synthase (glutamine-hydrolysing)